MGLGATITVRGTNNFQVHLYSHWDGDKLKGVLQAALNRGRDRWSDPSYLSRIIFSEMIQNHLMETTGYGISNTEIPCNRPLIVDCSSKTVSIGHLDSSPIILPMEDFIKLP